jgi:DNA-binding LacI/PurR family transcriptional regulator
VTVRSVGGPRRATIADIAARVGVSRGAVSYALNGRPGVADDTRRRVLEAAAELGWHPNAAARALTGSAVSGCGLVLARPTRTIAVEPYFMELIAGMESALSASSIGLTLQFVETVAGEVDVLRRWWAERRVDGVFLVDLRLEDPRIPVVRALGLPVVLVGGPEAPDHLAAVWSEDQETMAGAVRYLAKLGHRRIARIAGRSDFRHTQTRSTAFAAATSSLGVEGVTLHTDYMAETGARVTRQLLLEAAPPSAIIYDNDILAVAGLGVAHELGLDVPGDLSIIAWSDSPYCQVVHPQLTAIAYDIYAFGAQSATALLDLLRDGVVTNAASAPSVLIPRGSTGPPRVKA